MAGSIKLFQHLQMSYFREMGIYIPQSNQRCSSNWRNLCTAFFIAQLFFAAFFFLLFKAKSAFEYGTNFYTSISESCCFSYFAIQYCQMTNISKLIESCEKFIENSEYKIFCSCNSLIVIKLFWSYILSVRSAFTQHVFGTE